MGPASESRTALRGGEERNERSEWMPIGHIERHEASEPTGECRLTKMQRGIVRMELRADKVIGAWKLNQHKAERDFVGARDGLAVEADSGAKAIAAAIDALT